jgi:hypothetical protein
MLMTGKNVTNMQEPLQKITLSYIYNALLKTDSPLAAQIMRLRSLRLLDAKQYKAQKTNLPYIIGSIMQPALRRKENFVKAHYFIIDIDGLDNNAEKLLDIKTKLKTWAHTALLFTSPSGQGLKLIAALDTPIDDRQIYSLVYKQVAIYIANDYGLVGYVDMVTHDVARACFMSQDTDAYFNENAEPICVANYTNNIELHELKNIQTEILQAIELQNAVQIIEQIPIPIAANDVPQDIINQIKLKLNPNAIIKPIPIVYQPNALITYWTDIAAYLLTLDIQIIAEKQIPYGRQIKVSTATIWAELNVYYGKTGFKIVATTKSGSSIAFADTVKQALEQFLNNKF